MESAGQIAQPPTLQVLPRGCQEIIRSGSILYVPVSLGDEHFFSPADAMRPEQLSGRDTNLLPFAFAPGRS
jgi:hypothetical protein